MKVWIDSDLCTGVALCQQACPEVFVIASDGIARVVDIDGRAAPGRTAVEFADALLESVLEAAEDCPEECIYIE
ncbi:MAG: ferredoxin [Acidimicrobiia bacterium]|nr:ferredoxin [Acidimicrobiia bacterium]